MTTKTEMTKTIKMLANNDKSYSAILIVAQTLYSLSKEKAANLLAEAGIEKGAKNGANAAIFDMIRDGITETDLADYIIERGSPTTGKWFGPFWSKTLETADAIRESCGVEVTRLAATDEQKKALSSMSK